MMMMVPVTTFIRRGLNTNLTYDINTAILNDIPNDISVFLMKTLNIVVNIMKHIRSPLETVWYYVPVYNSYFAYIEHRPNGILLDGGECFGTPFVAPEHCCRIATYEEVRDFNNR